MGSKISVQKPSIRREKTFRFEPFGVQNARNRSHIAFVHSYAGPKKRF
uniref:Uncharacterized protein n=1 Tax=Escherichia coli TaxID=562 RepID=A0A7G9A9P9_ECOLX|nr:hypothetical protein [Escherichia coli]